MTSALLAAVMPLNSVWSHLPHWVRAVIIGNIVQAVFVAVVKLLRLKFDALGPVVDRIGPRAARSKGAKKLAGGFVAAVVWFALSWLVGHEALRLRWWVANRVLR